jgi:hypothetical protein
MTALANGKTPSTTKKTGCGAGGCACSTGATQTGTVAGAVGEGVSLRDNPVAHVKYQLGNAPVLTYPYEHMHVRGVFPDDFYAEIIENFPEARHFKSLIKDYPKRGSIDLCNPAQIDGLPEPQLAFWHEFVRCFGSRNFTTFILERYSPLLAGRLKHQVKPMMYLFHDMGGYGIGPHTDTNKKVVTNLFYLPADESMMGSGTSIVTPKDPNYRQTTAGHDTWDNYWCVKTVPFEPNSMLSFVVTDKSHHAVRPTPPGTARNSLQYFIVLPD